MAEEIIVTVDDTQEEVTLVVDSGVTKTELDSLNVAYTDVGNTFTLGQTVDLLSAGAFMKSRLAGALKGSFIQKDGSIEVEVINTLGQNNNIIFDAEGKAFSEKAGGAWDLGTNAAKWKELFLSSYANVLGVKSVENDATKVFATDGSVVDAGEENTIDSITAGEPAGSDQVVNVVSLTQAEYDAGVKIPTTKYVITDAPSSGLTESEVYEMRCNFNNAVVEQLPLVQTAYDNATTESLMMVPSGYKAGALVSQLPKTGIGDFTVARNSIKTRVNESGIIEEIAIDKIAPDFIDGGDGVWNFQPQSTNLYLDSELNNVENQTVTATPYTVFLYGTGTITFSGAYVGTLVGTGANDKVEITFTPAAGGLISTDSGTVSKKQLENLGYSTSYIKTEGATVTRLGDAVTGAGDETTFNSEEGVIYAGISALVGNGTLRDISISDGTTSNRITIGFTADGKLNWEVRSGGSYQGGTAIPYTITDNLKIALKWRLNDFALWVNGIEIVTDVVGNAPLQNTLTVLNLGNHIGSNLFYGSMKALKVFPFLKDTQLTELTTDGYVTTL